jgi:SAM-dependent methyltransferase
MRVSAGLVDAVSGRDGKSFSEMYANVEAYYSARVAKHGATPRGVDWSCQATQELRFVQLLKICDLSTPFSLNDIGCGYGALCAFLGRRHPQAAIDYLGIDLSRAMIRRARHRYSAPDRRFAVGKACPRIATYSVASGIMNVNLGYPRECWEVFVAEMLFEMRRTSLRGFSVNFVTDEVKSSVSANSSQARLYCTNPERWVYYCERELGCMVKTIDDYGMTEVTLLAHCKDL